jgi:DNA modification methylase
MKPYYQDDAVTLYHGDCLDILPQIGAVDHVITDPPYEAEAHTMARRVQRGAERGTAKARSEMRVETLPFAPITDADRISVSSEIARVCRRWVLVFCQAEAAHKWEWALVYAGMTKRRWCVWVKPDGQPQFSGDRPGMGYETIVACHASGKSDWNGGGRLGVFEHAKGEGRGPQWHPTTKPESLMRELVALFTDTGDAILDPYAGGGTTLVAAKRLGRKAIGIEKDERFCEMAVKRLQQSALDFVVAEAKPQTLPMGESA